MQIERAILIFLISAFQIDAAFQERTLPQVELGPGVSARSVYDSACLGPLYIANGSSSNSIVNFVNWNFSIPITAEITKVNFTFIAYGRDNPST